MPARVTPRPIRPKQVTIGPVQVKASGGAVLVWHGLGKAAAAPVIGAALGKQLVTGRRRHWFAPLWVACGVAAASRYWFPMLLITFAVSVACRSNAERWAGHGLSAREWELVSSAMLAATIWLGLCWEPVLVGRGNAILLAAATLGFAVPWWRGRRIRPATVCEHVEADQTPELIARWPQVVARYPDLAGEWAEWDEASGSGVLVLDHGRADILAKLAKAVESTLKTRAGAIRMRHDPDGYVDHLIVQYLPNPGERAVRIDYASSVQIDDKGRLWLGNTTDEREWFLPIWRDGGAAHLAITGTTGSGKGGTLGLVLTAMARDPRVWVCALDLKGGTGIPSVEAGVDLYGRTQDEWLLGVEIVHDITRERQDRYAELRASSWTPKDDPLIVLAIDESWRLKKVLQRKQIEQLQLISSQGRSLGVSQILATQRGDGDSLVSTTNRSNLMGGGTALMHAAGDSMSRILAAQDFDVDPDLLPRASGWVFPLSGIDPDSLAVPVRVRHIPTDKDREDGKRAPHGTIEEWMVYAQHAILHPADAQIAARWNRAPAPAVDPATLTHRGLSLVTEPPADGVNDPDPVDPPQSGVRGKGSGVRSLVNAGHTRPRATPDPLPLTPDPPLTHAERIVAELADGPLSRIELARRLGVSKTYISELLRRMEGSKVERTDDGKWRLM